MPRTKKQNKRKNAFATQIASMLIECKSWAEFNIKMILNGYELNSDMLVYLIHFAFVENFGWNAWNMAAEEMQSKTTIVKHAQSILVGMCEDNDAVFTDDMVDTIVKKTIFNISTIKDLKIPADIHRKMITDIARKNPAAFKKAYERYSTFARFKV